MRKTKVLGPAILQLVVNYENFFSTPSTKCMGVCVCVLVCWWKILNVCVPRWMCVRSVTSSTSVCWTNHPQPPTKSLMKSTLTHEECATKLILSKALPTLRRFTRIHLPGNEIIADLFSRFRIPWSENVYIDCVYAINPEAILLFV